MSDAGTAGLGPDRLRELLRRLVELSAGRLQRQEEIESTFASAMQSSQQAYESSKERIESTFEADRRAAELEHRASTSKIEQRYAAETEQAQRHFEVERSTISEKAEHNEDTARRMRDEAIWTAETVYEAREPHLRQEFEETRGELHERLTALQRIAGDADALLRRSRMRAPAAAVADSPANGQAPAEVADHAGDDEGPDDVALFERRAAEAESRLAALQGLGLPKLFRGPIPFVLVLAPAIGAGVVAASLTEWAVTRATVAASAAGLVAALVAVIATYVVARSRAIEAHRAVRELGVEGRAAYDRAVALAADRFEREMSELGERRDRDVRAAREKHGRIMEEIEQRRDHHMVRIDDKQPRVLDRATQQRDEDLAAVDRQYEQRRGEVTDRHERDSTANEERHRRKTEEIRQRHERGWSDLVRDYVQGMTAVHGAVREIHERCAELFPPFDDDRWTGWSPARELVPVVPFGTLDVDIERIPGGVPDDERLRVEGPVRFTLPATLAFPDRCSLLLESGADGRDEAVRTLGAVMMRLLTALPPGKVRFIIVDPVGLGRSFAGLMHLADHDESLVGAKIWTEARHIEQRLTDLTEHMENVIQKYLRNEFETIDQYNEHAGEIAEPYRFLVISDLPINLTDAAARRLTSIVNSGPRCGVHTLIYADTRQKMPSGLALADLARGNTTLRWEEGRFVWSDDDFRELPLALDPPPTDAFITRTLQLVGEAAAASSRVEVPFDTIAPPESERWSRSTESELRVPLGRAGATKLQSLMLGHGTSQHALIAGKTGSGKSTLLHVLITNLALWYSPHEIEFFLVDFKKGVEFKTYATHDLPHARAVAVESDREFGLSVLQRLDGELTRRGEIYRRLGIQDLAGYRRSGEREPMPRTMLIIDEFQEFFVEDDKLAQDAALLLDRLVRQGRAFGIHVLLGSQTLAGAYSLARSTLGQMAVRVALQCSEADSYLILSDDNAAARLLSRPGEAIYNDANGMVEGNSPFQICWLDESQRDVILREVAAMADERGCRRVEPQIVFEGNAPADVRRNHLLVEQLGAARWPQPPRAALAWLGDAVAIKDPTAAEFRRQSGSNLLIVGQRDEAALAMLSLALVGLAVQHAPGDVKFSVLDGTAPDAQHEGFLERVAGVLPHDVEMVGYRDVPESLTRLAAELEDRQQDQGAGRPSHYLIVYGLQRFRMLRQSDDFRFSMGEDEPAGPDRAFASLLRDGPPLGMHTLIWCDTLNNLNRTFDRQGLWEFDMRVLFQMSATDSSHLIDAPQAGQLGLRRALLYSEERGLLEKFRPYALPEAEWLEEVRASLAPRGSRAQ